MIKKAYFLYALLLASVLLTISCNGNKASNTGGPPGGGSGPGGAASNAIKDYPVITITPRTTTLYNDYPATIQGQQNIEIRPKIDGYVERMYVDEGATVRKGQLLFRISAPQYEQELRTAQANVKIAKADVDAAQMQVNKVRPLVEKDIISHYELESAQFTLQSRQAALAQAQAALANAKTNVGYTFIASPVSGVVGTIPYKIGSLVSSNTAQPLTTVSNIGNIYAYFSINEKRALDFTRNTKGATIQERIKTIPPVTLILSNGSEFPQKGRIETASGLINTETGSVSVRATFPNPGNIVRSGSSGLVRIPRTIDTAIMVPQKATYEIQGKKFVYVLESTGTVRSSEINVMESNNGQYYVVTSGLRPGDKVVLEGVATLKDGVAIRPRQVSADSVYQST
jgi:membrane fusion protein (multidrug efflux system)